MPFSRNALRTNLHHVGPLAVVPGLSDMFSSFAGAKLRAVTVGGRRRASATIASNRRETRQILRADLDCRYRIGLVPADSGMPGRIGADLESAHLSPTATTKPSRRSANFGALSTRTMCCSPTARMRLARVFFFDGIQTLSSRIPDLR